MSIFTGLTTKLIASTLAVAGGVGGFVTLAASNPTMQQDFKNVQSAIISKDLNAYKTAENQLITDKAKAQTDKVNSITQDQLNKMSDKLTKAKATQDAIKNNDYNAFKANADKRMLNRVTDQAGFDKLVANYKTHQDELNKISDAIKNNDFNAFKTVVQDVEKNLPTNSNKNRPTPTDAQLQTQFDKMVAQYKADGTLPNSDNSLMMGGHGFGGEMGGDFKGFGVKGGMGRGSYDMDDNLTTTQSAQTTTSSAVSQ